MRHGISTSGIEFKEGIPQTVTVANDALTVDLADGRAITVPVAWFQRLARSTNAKQANWRPIGRSEGISWPDLDEDISVKTVLAGRRSAETPRVPRQMASGAN